MLGNLFKSALHQDAGNFNAGISVVVAVLFVILIVITEVDLYYEVTDQTPIGWRVRNWAQANPLLAAGLLLGLGALLGHFFGNDLVYSTLGNT